MNKVQDLFNIAMANIREHIADEADRREWDQTVTRLNDPTLAPSEGFANSLILIGLYPSSTATENRDIPALLASAEARKYMSYKAGHVILGMQTVMSMFYEAVEDHRADLLRLNKLGLNPEAAKLVATMRERLDKVHDDIRSMPNPEKGPDERYERLGTPAADAFAASRGWTGKKHV